MPKLDTIHESGKGKDEIWYFGYGPIMHPAVRERRKVATASEQPAILLDHRLTFAFGGVASIIPRRGYSVQGVLMKISTTRDWQRLKEFDSGYYVQQIASVFPYDNSASDAVVTQEDPFGEAFHQRRAVKAYVFVMNDFEESLLDKPIEIKPQERYLRLILEGMRIYGVDETYIEDEIMACPYVPKLAPEDYRSFPTQSDDLPIITMKKYEKLCRQKTEYLYFILHEYVLKADPHNPGNPAAVWLRVHGHGKGDLSFCVHELLVDPDIPWAGTPEGMTPIHYLWAENQTFEFLQQAGFSATKVFRLDEAKEGVVRRWRRSIRHKPKTKTTKS